MPNSQGRPDQDIRQKQRKWFWAYQVARTPHCVPKTKRLLLPAETCRARWRNFTRQRINDLKAPAIAKGAFKLKLLIEMVLDDVLVTPSYKDKVLNSGLARLVNDILN